jgi:hypothetical protein
LKGILSERGMASFAEALKPTDTEAIRAYIVSRANFLKKNPALDQFAAPPPGQNNQHDQK